MFDEIESEVNSKEKFLHQQEDKLKEMHEQFNTFLEYKNVVAFSMEVIGAHKGRNEDEERA
jgi:hypothetical protein